MKLISPIGVRLSVADYRVPELLKQGYRVAEDSPRPAPVVEEAPKPRRRRTPTDK